MPRPGTIEDYQWLYEHANYMPNGLKCARDALIDLVELMPGTLLDVGGGRGHLGDWMMRHTRCRRARTIDPAIGDRDHDGATVEKVWLYDVVTSFDVLEHIHVEHAGESLLGMSRASRRWLMFTICTDSDVHMVRGEPVELHINRSPREWWTKLIDEALPLWNYRYKPCAEGSRHLFILERR